MNGLDDMPPKCQDCPFWEFAEEPYICDKCMAAYREADKANDVKAIVVRWNFSNPLLGGGFE